MIMDGDKAVSIYFEYQEDVIILGDNGSVYNVSSLVHENIVTIFDDIFPSTYTVTNSTDMDKAILRFKQYRTSGYISRDGFYNPFLYRNITTHLDNLATDFSNIIRSSKGSIEMVPGMAFDLIRVVEVRWPWLSLPLGLLIFTLIFLVATIIRSSSQQDVGVWKTSAIAALLYGLPDDVREKITSKGDQGATQAKAKTTKVRWYPGTGWRLSGTTIVSNPL